jgi:hypothetical protein
MNAMPAEKIENLRCYFAEREDVAFAFLFGSQARGTATRNSDTDIAVYFTPTGEERFEYQGETVYPAENGVWDALERIAGSGVELIVLNRTSAVISASALRGIPLHIRDWSLYIDFLLVATDEAEGIREAQFQRFLSENADG